MGPGGLLRPKSLEDAPGSLVPRELKTRRDAIEVHVESRQEVWSLAGMGAAVCAGDSDVLVLDGRGQEPKARSLCSIKKWGLQGLEGED